jgi:predicted RNA-binding Zn-ribbon protein involved in translation (DUF1610 family)
MPRTDDINQVAGTYNCDSCGEPITVALWHRFPPCPRCGERRELSSLAGRRHTGCSQSR